MYLKPKHLNVGIYLVTIPNLLNLNEKSYFYSVTHGYLVNGE